jgi:hypothetical protein
MMTPLKKRKRLFGWKTLRQYPLLKSFHAKQRS